MKFPDDVDGTYNVTFAIQQSSHLYSQRKQFFDAGKRYAN